MLVKDLKVGAMYRLQDFVVIPKVTQDAISLSTSEPDGVTAGRWSTWEQEWLGIRRVFGNADTEKTPSVLGCLATR